MKPPHIGAQRNEPWRDALDRHQNDPYAHGALIARLLDDYAPQVAARNGQIDNLQDGLTSVRRFIWLLTGGLITLGVVFSGAGVALFGLYLSHLGGGR